MDAIDAMRRMANRENARMRSICRPHEGNGKVRKPDAKPIRGALPDPEVSARRVQVKALIGAGLTHQEIANRLGVTRETVKKDAWVIRHGAIS